MEMFLDVDRIEASALLAVVAELAGDDEVLAARIRRELAERGDGLPEWLARLGEAEVYRAREMVHVLGDGDNVNIAVRFAGGAELTAVVYIDHNMGTLVKDAFVVPESLAGLEVLMREKVDDPDTEWRDLDLADARVRITEAIDLGGDDRAAVRDRLLAGVPPDRRVAHSTNASRWGGLPAAGVERPGPAEAGRPVLRLAVRRTTRRRRPPGVARDGDLVRRRLRARRSVALEPGGGRDHPRRLDPPQDRRRRPVSVEGAGSAAGVHPVLPRRAPSSGRT